MARRIHFPTLGALLRAYERRKPGEDFNGAYEQESGTGKSRKQGPKEQNSNSGGNKEQ